MTKRRSNSVTIRDVARRAGVSVATVSRYINRSTPVSDEVARRVLVAMEELNFAPHSAARKLATNKNYTLGLLLTDMYGDFFGPLLSGIEEVARQTGYDLLISSSRRANVRKGSPLGPHNTDGLMVFADSLSEATLTQFYKIGFPVLLIHRTGPDGMNTPCVTVENKAASRKIVEHLIHVHHRQRIVFLRGPDEQEDAYWRELGYRAALEAHGIPIDLTLIAPGEFDRRVAQTSIRNLLKQGVKFDAVFSGDDEAAVGVLAALQEAGKLVPEDVSVVGFDDQRMSAFLTPPLTTIRAPTETVGKTAAQQLVQLIQTGHADPITLLPTELVLRRSCGCEEYMDQ